MRRSGIGAVRRRYQPGIRRVDGVRGPVDSEGVDVGLLGPVHVDHGSRGLGPRDRVVLSALAVSPGSVLSADQLADALWRESPPDSWPKVVQGCIVRLRKALGAEAVETTPHGYRLDPTRLSLDTLHFERLVERGNEHLADGVPERASTVYREAQGLWRGLPFEELQEWDGGRQEAERLLELRRSCDEELLAARLAAGERALTADAQTLVAAEPWRERRWALLALAQYREGRQADALASVRRARRALQEQLGLDTGAELVSLEAAILRQDPSLDEATARVVQDTCPWKGLASYDADDRESFHGREQEIVECLTRLDQHPLLVLAGPSGCGKSSLLRAGVVPALRERGRDVVLMVPGPDPAATMAAALAGTRSDPVLVIDQFEEVFTLRNDPASARAWLAELAAYATTRASLVVAVRADHVADLGSDPALARLAEAGLHLVSPLVGERLREAIEGPARGAGLRLEHGLVDLLLRDSEDEPGALPLLSHALAETWLRREGRLLTVAGYREAGGIRGAVARSADRLYEGLAPGERTSLRWTLLRLVATSPDGEPFRTRVPSASVAGDPGRERIVDLLARARLVTVSDTSVELAHEALARAWPRLRSWLDEDAGGQRIWRHLTTAADGWHAMGRPESELYRGARLDLAEEWVRQSGADITDVEAAYLEASRARVRSTQQQLEQQSRAQQAQNRRLRRSLAGIGLLLVVALAAGFLAVDRSRTALADRDTATRAQATSLHESLTNRSLALRATNRGLAALLAVEAYRQQPDALARSALLGTFTWSPGFLGYEYVDTDFLNGVMVPGRDEAVVAAEGRELAVLDLATGTLDRRFPRPATKELGYSDLRVSADGRYVAQQVMWDRGDGCGSTDAFTVHDGRGCTRLGVYDLRSGKRVMRQITGPFSGGDIALNRDGSLVAMVGGKAGDLAVYRTRDGRRVGLLPGLGRPAGVTVWRDTAAVTFGPDGHTVYLGSMAGPVRRVQVPSMRVTRTYAGPLMSSANFVLLSRRGILVTGGTNAIVAYDVASGRRRWTVDLRTAMYEDPCPFLGIADAAGTVYCGNYFGQIEERDLSDGSRTGRTLDPQIGSVGDLAVGPDGRELIAFAAQSGIVSRWRLDGSGPVTRVVARGRVATDGYSAGLLATASRAALLADRVPGAAAVWDPDRDASVATIPGASEPGWLAEGRLVARWQDDSSDIYDLQARRRTSASILGPDVDGLWRSPGGTRVFAAVIRGPERPAQFEVRAYDARTLDRVGRSVTVRGYAVRSVSMTRDDRRLVVTTNGEDGGLTQVFSTASGKELERGLEGQEQTLLSPAGLLAAASPRGELNLFDLDTLQPVAAFPGARGLVSSLQFDDDGSTLVVTSPDQAVQIFDVRSGLRLGDAIPSESPRTEGWLRPDGDAVAINVRAGVAVWELDPDHLLSAACRLAGRNLTRTEWSTYVGTARAYRHSCPVRS